MTREEMFMEYAKQDAAFTYEVSHPATWATDITAQVHVSEPIKKETR